MRLCIERSNDLAPLPPSPSWLDCTTNSGSQGPTTDSWLRIRNYGVEVVNPFLLSESEKWREARSLLRPGRARCRTSGAGQKLTLRGDGVRSTGSARSE